MTDIRENIIRCEIKANNNERNKREQYNKERNKR